jgi:uncharacterized lipoprotein YddW (UPF0748 family)
VKRGGKLSKDDWRRDNVDKLVEALYKGVHAVKPWVKVGISPFGIWRPGNPAQIKGFDAYTEIYADSKKWLQNGWADYFAPQLYWPIAQTPQAFPVLYDWWQSVNTKKRHMWPGLATYRIAEKSARTITSSEIVAEIDTLRARGDGTGHIHFSMKVLMTDADSIDERLAVQNAQPALIPASPWLGAKKPGKPTISLGRDRATDEPVLHLAPAQGEKVWLWTVRSLSGGQWKREVVPGWVRVHRLASAPEQVIVEAISRTGVAGISAKLISK